MKFKFNSGAELALQCPKCTRWVWVSRVLEVSSKLLVCPLCRYFLPVSKDKHKAIQVILHSHNAEEEGSWYENDVMVQQVGRMLGWRGS